MPDRRSGPEGTWHVHRSFRRDRHLIVWDHGINGNMRSPNKPVIARPPLPRAASHGFSAPQIAVMFAALTLLISIPVWIAPLSDPSIIWAHACDRTAQPCAVESLRVDWQVIP